MQICISVYLNRYIYINIYKYISVYKYIEYIYTYLCIRKGRCGVFFLQCFVKVTKRYLWSLYHQMIII